MAINYYFSGVSSHSDEDFLKLTAATPHRLLSCHGAYSKYGHLWLSGVMQGANPKRNTILLDSGAFTAWNQGHEVTLDDLVPVYWDFMSRYWTSLNEIYLINLDKIPGSPGRTPGAAEIADCIRISDENYQKLRSLFGDRVLPVFHQGESEERLMQVASMGEYVCVSPRNDLPEMQRVKWSREVHTKLPTHTKTHGLAATGIAMMTSVPWHSVDSASWIFTASTGAVTLCLNGKMVNFGASDNNSMRHNAGQHLSNLDPVVLERAVLPRLEKLGFTVDQLAQDHRARMTVSMMEIQYWVDHFHRFAIEPAAGLFDL